jgi:3-dehydroquinate synthase
MKWSVQTTQHIKYDIIRNNNLFEIDDTDLEFSLSRRVLVFIDRNVNNLYSEKINKYFDSKNMSAKYILVGCQEENKNINTLFEILTEIENFGIDRRNEPILVIGGGVLCDLVGTACSLYRRGVPYVRIPTTLLGMVDVSVAAKVAVNWKIRRNRLGGYYPPKQTFIDTSFLKTVSDIEISSGMGEILKIAVIKDNKLFSILEQNSSELFITKFLGGVSDSVIDLSCVDMIEELQDNLWETNLKRCVDFGHSFSPIIEMRSLEDNDVPSLTHGNAVVLDVIFSSIISANRRLFTFEDVNRIIQVAKDMRLSIDHQYFKSPALLYESLQDTQKHRNGNQNLPLPTEIGNYTFVQDVTYTEIRDVVKIYKELIK